MAEPWQDKIRRAWRSAWRANWPLAAITAALVVVIWKIVRPHRSEAATSRAVTSPAPAGADSYPSENHGVAFEPSDWALKPVALVYVGMLVLLVVSALVLIAAYPNALPDVARTVRIAPPGPRLQTDPQGDLRRFLADEDKRLNGYYWINKSQGIVHIPIGEAMRKLATTGIPGFPKGQQ